MFAVKGMFFLLGIAFAASTTVAIVYGENSIIFIVASMLSFNLAGLINVQETLWDIQNKLDNKENEK